MSSTTAEWIVSAVCALVFACPFWWTSRRDKRDTLLSLLVYVAAIVGAFGLLQLRLAL